ncbi:MAG TPA: hypothetical protein VFA75_05965 [Nevskia sp.]|nr:hypothetical protein [Nevskia sp.]
MQQVDAASLARGYAEILRADGAMALLRLHARGGGEAPQQEERLLYAVARHDQLLYVSEQPERATARFDSLVREHGGEADGSPGREDFLATMPMHLPTIRGAAYHRLAAQVPELSGSQEAHL